MVTATFVDPASLCADYQRRGLARIAATIDAVPYVTFCNLANLNAAMRGGLLDLIEVHLRAVRRWTIRAPRRSSPRTSRRSTWRWHAGSIDGGARALGARPMRYFRRVVTLAPALAGTLWKGRYTDVELGFPRCINGLHRSS
jgi:hypothetical protein